LEKIESMSTGYQIENGIESRKEWMLDRFMFVAQRHSKNEKYQFWTHENHAIHLYNHKFMREKLECLHNNPVIAGIVEKPEDYLIQVQETMPG
jgi:putative transposase